MIHNGRTQLLPRVQRVLIDVLFSLATENITQMLPTARPRHSCSKRQQMLGTRCATIEFHNCGHIAQDIQEIKEEDDSNEHILISCVLG